MVVFSFEVPILQNLLRCQVMPKDRRYFWHYRTRRRCFPPSASHSVWHPCGTVLFPLVGHHYYRHHLYMRTNPNEPRTRPNDISRGGSYSTAARGSSAGKTDQTDREARTETSTEALESCTGLAPGVTNLPIDQIRQTVHPTADQEAALDDFSEASSQASDVIKSSCPSVPLTPVGRLDAAEQRLEATIKAIQIVRSPLERFYQALSDEQRQRFNAMNGSTEGARSATNVATLCSQQAGSFINLPVQRIEQVVQPTVQQQSAFDDLKKVTQNAGDQLQSSCPTAVPKSPVARLDIVETRLSAMADAIKAVRPSLKSFYASLSDDQKAKFNVMGLPPKSASSDGGK
jgi:ABC-type transporter MlaC component